MPATRDTLAAETRIVLVELIDQLDGVKDLLKARGISLDAGATLLGAALLAGAIEEMTDVLEDGLADEEDEEEDVEPWKRRG